MQTLKSNHLKHKIFESAQLMFNSLQNEARKANQQAMVAEKKRM